MLPGIENENDGISTKKIVFLFFIGCVDKELVSQKRRQTNKNGKDVLL